MRYKIYKVIFILLIIALLVVISLIVMKYYERQINEKQNREAVETFSASIEKIQKQEESENKEETTSKNEDVTLNGYKIIGIVKIPKINLEYPILDIDTYNPDETKEPMKMAIVKYWGGQVNEYGNLSIAGHNNYDGTMFGKTKQLEVGDIVEMTDLTGSLLQYKIYNKFVTDPNDVTILETKDKTIREITLITCTNGNKSRLILKAKEI